VWSDHKRIKKLLLINAPGSPSLKPVSIIEENHLYVAGFPRLKIDYEG
jgi:hypothetical protein